jgi:hypothetical protein
MFYFVCFYFLVLVLTTEAMGIWRYPFHGMFHLREHSLSWNDKVNAGAKLPECTSASQ